MLRLAAVALFVFTFLVMASTVTALAVFAAGYGVKALAIIYFANTEDDAIRGSSTGV